jgi:hypothetical protein
MRMVRGLWLCAFVVLGLIGCGSSKTSVAGTWVMSESSRQYVPTQLRGPAPRLVVNADGSFSASNLPGAFHGSAEIISNSGQGRWKRVTDEGRDQLQLIFEGGYGTQLLVSDSWGGPTLTYFLGDPDQGRRIELQKSPLVRRPPN